MNSNTGDIYIEAIGWLSTAAFLLSIVLPQRIRLHEWGLFTAVTTGIYAFHHGATAIWVKWFIAFFFHLYMWVKLKKLEIDSKLEPLPLKKPVPIASLLLVITILPGRSAEAITLAPRDLQLEVFSRTRIGRQISEAILGVPVRNSADLDRLLALLNSRDPRLLQVRSELELRIPQLARELEKLPPRASLPDPLEALASRILRFEAGPEGIHFYPFQSELASASFSRNAQSFLEGAPLSRFELGIPRSPRSIDRSLLLADSISERLARLEGRYVHELGVLDAETIAHRLALKKPRVTVKDITDEILRIRGELTEIMTAWAQEYRSRSPQLSEQIRKTVHELTLSPEAFARYQQKAHELARLSYEPGVHDDLIRGYNGKLQGELGELRVLVRVNDFTARGLKTFELSTLFPSTVRGQAAKAALASHLESVPQYSGKELDLILDGGRVWAEVKTFRDIFSREHRQFRHVVEQLELTQAIEAHLRALPEWRSIFPDPIQLRIYFVGGITEDAARILESKGVEVFGARVGFAQASP